ncbi:hypothetical protein RND81_13G087900 [Saponaria officinalis]|uniref:Uncharacterized protein n=1 Tax=Saponaria officinalis TaxID=3572 RepID=A0AAW1GVD1_SAPOF
MHTPTLFILMILISLTNSTHTRLKEAPPKSEQNRGKYFNKIVFTPLQKLIEKDLNSRYKTIQDDRHYHRNNLTP